MFKLIRRLLILGLAAAIGTVYYQRTTAVTNIAAPVASESKTLKAKHSSQNKGGIGKVGGLGPVGNPGSYSQPTYYQDPQHTNNR